MRNKIILLASILLSVVYSCTKDFDEINERPDALSVSDVSAKFFVTSLQKGLFKPTAGPLWFGQIFHQDQYAGQHSGGHSQYAWDGNFGWEYTNWLQEGTNGWLAGYNSSLTAYMNLVSEGGVLENDQYYAIGLIMKGLYYQLYTDQVGMIPYSEASDPDITLPRYDAQIDIYRGVISELNQAISIIGNNSVSGDGVDRLAENDILFNGDMQKWKKLAASEAEAIVKGLVPGDAAGHYDIGLNHAMELWGAAVDADFLASDMGTLSGSTEEKLEKLQLKGGLLIIPTDMKHGQLSEIQVIHLLQ